MQSEQEQCLKSQKEHPSDLGISTFVVGVKIQLVFMAYNLKRISQGYDRVFVYTYAGNYTPFVLT